jgi:hypothetical protein
MHKRTNTWVALIAPPIDFSSKEDHMSATPIPDAHGAAPADSTDKNRVNSVYDLLYRLLTECPLWVRVIAIVVILTFLGLYLMPKAMNAPVQEYSPRNGVQVDGPGNAGMADSTLHLKEEDAHSRWHEEHPEDSPPLKTIFKITDDNYLAYKFYDKSDRCVFVLRRENGVSASRWVRDPMSMHAANEVPHDVPSVKPSPAGFSIAGLFDGLVPSANAAQLSPALTGTEQRMHPVQSGCVQGTHPGQFNWWWGAPEDQCWTPMYRQWKDGCKHYQRYNKCSNAWDDRIVWVSCSAGPHS